MWTAEQAAAMSRRGAEASVVARRKRAEAALHPILALTSAEPEPDAFASRLMHAQEQKLDALLSCTDARECANLAQSIRHLRETYHMVTGLAKPGVTKPQAQRQGKRAYASQGPPAGWDSTQEQPHTQHTTPSASEAGADYCI